MSTPLHEEIINEIGTQTLARFGLNIFNLNTYGAYAASVEGTINVNETYNQHKNNPNYFGHTFEELDTAKRNIYASLHNKDEFYSTTDRLGEINHPITDVRKLNSDREILENYQHKVIKDSAGLFGKNNKYLENDKIVVPKDDYEHHKNYLEKMIQNTRDDETRRNAKELLNKLEASEITRDEAINARTTSVKIQTTQAGNHIVQTGISDAVIFALSTLANGAIFEIKDALNNPDVPIKVRIKRLLEKVWNDFKEAFKRGASYGSLEVGIGIVSQIFKSFADKIMQVWKSLRNSAKSIFNAIYNYITGKIKTFRELLSIIIKGILSAIMVVGVIALETQLESFLAPLFSPLVASYLAPAISIVIGGIAVVLMRRAVDAALNALFGIFAKADLARMRAEKVKEICAELLPKLITEKEKLKDLIDSTFKERKLKFEMSFAEFKQGLTNNDINSVICGLEKINNMYGKHLQFVTFEEFDKFMCDPNTSLVL